MISTSQAWKDYSRDTGIFHIRATMTGGSTVNLTDSDFMMGSVSFTDSIGGMSEITFGSVVTNTFTATLVNTDGRFDNWTWNKISVEFGYNNEWISRGVFNIDRPETIGSTVKIECYDDMDKLNQYFKGFISQTFPVTYKALIQAICTACGVTFGTWANGIPNSNVTALVSSAFNESTTCRQVVSWILEVCGAYARINPVTHRLDCKVWNGTGGYNLTGVKEQSIYIDDVTITGVRAYTYETSDEYDYATAGTDGYVVYIRDNPFVSATNKASIAAQALANGGGGSVRPFTASIFGDPAMEAGDIVTFTDRRNNTYTSVITSLTYVLNGTTRVSCDAKTPQDNALDYSNPYDSAVWASIAYTDSAVEGITDDLKTQIDAKIETFYQTTDPSTSWTTADLRNAHTGDIWHNSSTNESLRWSGTAWQEFGGVPQSLIDEVDGKSTIYYGTTTSVTSADEGDYLVDKTNGITYRWTSNAWVEQISSPAVNLLPPVYRREYMVGSNTWTSEGITWTVNDDGSITATGTATGTSYFVLTGSSEDRYPPRAVLDPTKRYRLHGCPAGGKVGSTYYYYIAAACTLADGSQADNQTDTGEGVTLRVNTKTAYIYCTIMSGFACPAGGLTFYPMLEEGTVNHAYVSPKNANANYATTQVTVLDNSFDQTKVFNRLTNNGAMQGLYMDGGDMYVNATYIKTGTLTADRIGAGTIEASVIAKNLKMEGGELNVTASGKDTAVIDLDWSNNAFIYHTQATPNGIKCHDTFLTTSPVAYRNCTLGGGGLAFFQDETYDGTNATILLTQSGQGSGDGTFTGDLTAKRIFVNDSGNLRTVPYLVSSSVNSSNWSWEKWSDGKMECWMRSTYSININLPYGALYYQHITGITFPSAVSFIAIPSVVITVESANGGDVFVGYEVGSTTGIGRICCYSAATYNGNVTANIHVLGRWK